HALRRIEALAAAEEQLVALVHLLGGEVCDALVVHVAPDFRVRGRERACSCREQEDGHDATHHFCSSIALSRRAAYSSCSMDSTNSESKPSSTFTASRSSPSKVKPSVS